MKTRILAIPMMTLMLAGCVTDTAEPSLPVSHPANPQAVEVAYTPPPNVLTLETTALAPPSGDDAKHGAAHEGAAAPGADHAKKPGDYPLDVCVVSGEKLGSMGKPVVMQHDGREIQLCCKGCIKDFNKEPAKFVAKFDAAVAAQGGKTATKAGNDHAKAPADHSEHAQPKPVPQPQAAPAKHAEHADPKPVPQPEAAPPKHDDHADQAHKAIHVSEATQAQIDALSKAYLALTAMLAEDKTQGAADQLAAISKAAKALTEAKEGEVAKVAAKIVKATLQKADNLEAVRESLKALSDSVIELAHLAPPSTKVAAIVYQANCPHVKASWLQSGEKIANPYYGSEMLRCGKITQKIQGAEGHKH